MGQRVITVSVVTGLVLGLAPVLGTTRQDLTRDLRERGRLGPGGTYFRRLRSVLVVGEVAVALVLLVGAGTAVVNSSFELSNSPTTRTAEMPRRGGRF